MKLLEDKTTEEQLTSSAYRDLIQQLQRKGYRFAAFPEAKSLLAARRSFVLMRHDIDMDLEAALRMARMEAESAVRSTYFFLLRTEHYNLFSAEGTSAVRQILELGHHLGLHFDCSSYPGEFHVDELAKACDHEAAILEAWFGKPVSIVSFHRPDHRVLTGEPGLSAPRDHTYMPIYTQTMKYVADSTGRWRYGAPTKTEEFRRVLPLQILVHPVWWNDRETTPNQALSLLLDRKATRLRRSFEKNCTVFRSGSAQLDIQHPRRDDDQTRMPPRIGATSASG
jgi:hypothetical protein